MALMRALRRGLAAAALLAWAAAGAAGTLIHERFDSPRLGREVGYTAFLPGPAAPSLVLVLLHGSGGDERHWVRDGALAAALQQALQAVPGAPMALVMPSLGPDSWWTDGAAAAAASALIEELLPRAEARLRLAPGARRALAGVSMGGYGALQLALWQPQRFCAAALVAPAVYDPLPPAASGAWRSPQFARGGGFDAALWHALHPLRRLDAYAGQPHRVPLWIVSGDDDELGIAAESARLFERLRALQPHDVELRIVDGRHDGPTFDAALPAALAYVGRRCAPAEARAARP